MEHNVGIFSFTVKNRDIAEVADDLDRHSGIMVRVGLHCSPSAHKLIGTFPQGTIRASIGYYSTEKEAKYLVRSLRDTCAVSDERCIVIFPSTYFALRAERAVQDAGIPSRMIPVPRTISPDCNMGMEASIHQGNHLKMILETENIEFNLVIPSGNPR